MFRQLITGNQSSFHPGYVKAKMGINVKTEKKSYNWRSYTNKIKRSDSENINCVDAFFKNESQGFFFKKGKTLEAG